MDLSCCVPDGSKDSRYGSVWAYLTFETYYGEV